MPSQFRTLGHQLAQHLEKKVSSSIYCTDMKFTDIRSWSVLCFYLACKALLEESSFQNSAIPGSFPQTANQKTTYLLLCLGFIDALTSL
jgi:hypothetical protein